MISIHALREEGDAARDLHGPEAVRISIHALREEGDTPRPASASSTTYFYPRPPRGRRRCCRPPARGLSPISIHALREEGDAMESIDKITPEISIHALREEGDPTHVVPRIEAALFLSTPSARKATPRAKDGPHQLFQFLSTPSARKATFVFCNSRLSPCDFYPRPPRGRRRWQSGWPMAKSVFLSTPSARKATAALRLLHPRRPISIHALREEGDMKKASIF